jgi:Excalibur calcium-binding domain
MILLLAGIFAATGTMAQARLAKIPAKWKNCHAVNKRYPHGVGRNRAHDKTSGVPVTNFKRSTKLYKRAMHYNKGLDRDHDGIACEKA